MARTNPKAELWRRRIARWARSRLSQVEFCRRNGVPIYAFRWWKHRLYSGGTGVADDKARRSRRGERALFVPVKLVEPRVAATPLGSGAAIEVELDLTGGRTLRIRCDSFDPERLRQILSIVLGLATC